MDLIKKLTGKNPNDFEPVAQSLVDNADIEMFKKLVQQDDFLFDFIKNNVAQRIKSACNKSNFLNLFNFLKIYSKTYETIFAEILLTFGGVDVFEKIKFLLINGSDAEKAYSVKYLLLSDKNDLTEFLPSIREYAKSEFEPLSTNSIELLAKMKDTLLKDEAILQLNSKDEFEQFDAVKFLVLYGAKDVLDKIISVMKKSTLAENIASEILYLIPQEELFSHSYENALLVLCNIISAIPDICQPSIIYEHSLNNSFDYILSNPIDSQSAVLLRLAKDKINELISNEEYLFDVDNNTKREIRILHNKLCSLNEKKLNSFLYDELFEGSDFVLFALDYADEIDELETLLDSSNPTVVLKTLTRLKDKNLLTQLHKDTALQNVEKDSLKNVILAL